MLVTTPKCQIKCQFYGFCLFFLLEFFLNQATESCLGVLNNQYNDSVTWHDIGKFNGEI